VDVDSMNVEGVVVGIFRMKSYIDLG